LIEVGSHDLAVRKVLDGEIDAGAAKDTVFDRLAGEDPRIERELRILAESDPVPENALVVRSTVRIPCARCHEKVGAGIRSAAAEELDEPRIRERLRELLLNLDGTEEGRRILGAVGADRFIETTDADYRNLYRMIDELWLGPPPE
jgi:phosphonate transport system substrate-binding protein